MAEDEKHEKPRDRDQPDPETFDIEAARSSTPSGAEGAALRDHGRV